MGTKVKKCCVFYVENKTFCIFAPEYDIVEIGYDACKTNKRQGVTAQSGDGGDTGRFWIANGAAACPEREDMAEQYGLTEFEVNVLDLGRTATEKMVSLVRDFDAVWTSLRPVYERELSELAYRTLPDSEEVAESFKTIAGLLVK